MTFVFHCQREVESLCYTLLPMVFDRLKQPSADRSLVIVVSPLITLMKDLVRSLLEKNVQLNIRVARYINVDAQAQQGHVTF